MSDHELGSGDKAGSLPLGFYPRLVRSARRRLLAHDVDSEAGQPTVVPESCIQGALGTAASPRPDWSARLDALRAGLAESCRQMRLSPTCFEIEVLELLLAGHNLDETAYRMGLPPSDIRAARNRWRVIVERCLAQQATMQRADA